MPSELDRGVAQAAYFFTAIWRDCTESFVVSFRLFFRPITRLFGNDDFEPTYLEDLTRKSSRVRGRQNWHLKYLKDVTDFNQGAMTEYTLLAGEMHKTLKQSLYGKKDADLEVVVAKTNEMLNYLNQEFYKVANQNFEFLHDYFDRRGTIAPRICFKGNLAANGSTSVVSIFRDKEVKYDSDTAISNNTAFHSIWMTGKYYLENDLPEATLHGRYRNPRLKIDEIGDVYRGMPGSERKLAREWEVYWKEYHSKGDVRDFYRSTLVTPLIISSRGVSSGFKMQIQEKIGVQDFDRAILGFLCCDHYDTDYFEGVNDVLIGHTIADLMSVFAFSRLMYTDASTTFRTIMRLLKHTGMDIKLDKHLWALHDVESHRNRSEPASIFSETKNNALLPIDEVLLRFAKSDTKKS